MNASRRKTGETIFTGCNVNYNLIISKFYHFVNYKFSFYYLLKDLLFIMNKGASKCRRQLHCTKRSYLLTEYSIPKGEIARMAILVVIRHGCRFDDDPNQIQFLSRIQLEDNLFELCN